MLYHIIIYVDIDIGLQNFVIENAYRCNTPSRSGAAKSADLTLQKNFLVKVKVKVTLA